MALAVPYFVLTGHIAFEAELAWSVYPVFLAILYTSLFHFPFNDDGSSSYGWDYVLLKERAERLYSFLNGVAKIRLCKCWQLIYVQLLGNQKCNCSCVLHSKYKIKTLSFQNFKCHTYVCGKLYSFISRKLIADLKLFVFLHYFANSKVLSQFCLITWCQNIYQFRPKQDDTA